MSEETKVLLHQFAAQVTGSKPVEFLRTGTFTDMNGNEVTISESDLDRIIEVFSSNGAGQDVPIDVDHERGQAAGWVKRVYRQGNKLLAEVEWNKLGQELVGDRIYRYLSATLSIARGVLLSISLVNFPAVKGLAPVELGEHDPEDVEKLTFFIAPDESLQTRTDLVFRAFYRAYPFPEYNETLGEYPAPTERVVDILDQYVVFERDGAILRMPYSFSEEGKIEFDSENTVPVRQAWVDLVPAELAEPVDPETVTLGNQEDPMPNRTTPVTEEEIQDEALLEDGQETTELSEDQSQDADPVTPMAEDEDALDVAALRAQLRDEILGELRQEMTEDIRSFQTGRSNMVREIITELREEQELAQFAMSVTATGKNALPFKATDLASKIGELPRPVRKVVVELLDTIHKNGTIDFSEVGHQKGVKPEPEKAELDTTTLYFLSQWLDSGNGVEEFFAANPELGDAGQYDLSAFSKDKEE